MDGPGIVVRTVSATRENADAYGNHWQYNSRSDHHSKVACWAVLFDLLQASALFRLHVAAGRVIFGVNQEMRDFKTRRKKDLDLVIARPGTADPEAKTSLSFAELGAKWAVVLDDAQRARLEKLPDLHGGAVGSVLVALEAKACMTAHSKSRPRLYDELNSSHLTVHGASDQAIAIGFVMLNNATEFVSPGLNKHDLSIHPPVVNHHRQPAATKAVDEKVRELPTRTKTSEEGYDAIGIVVVDCVNDGTPVTVVTKPPAPPPSDLYHYDQMVRRAAQIYDTRFAGI